MWVGNRPRVGGWGVPDGGWRVTASLWRIPVSTLFCPSDGGAFLSPSGQPGAMLPVKVRLKGVPRPCTRGNGLAAAHIGRLPLRGRCCQHTFSGSPPFLRPLPPGRAPRTWNAGPGRGHCPAICVAPRPAPLFELVVGFVERKWRGIAVACDARAPPPGAQPTLSHCHFSGICNRQ